MPRRARRKGEFSTYHVIMRGNEKKNLFNSDDDRNRFIDTLDRMKQKYNFHLYAYCLMDNHIHLLIYDNGNDISKIIKSINISYAYYFNRIYKRCGHLFQDRFISELVEDDRYLLEVSKYIHNNPVKAGMIKSPEEYNWSSYKYYSGKVKKNENNFIGIERILEQISRSYRSAVIEYIKYVNKKGDMELGILDVENYILPARFDNSMYIYDKESAEKLIAEISAKEGIPYEGLIANKVLRDNAIREIRKKSLLTLKQIGELFGGLSESRISRIL